MASPLANLVIRIGADTKDALKGLSGLQRSLRTLKDEATKTRSVMGLMAGAAGFGYVAKQAFELGAAVEETGSKFATVFGDGAKDVQDFIDSFATMAGLSNEQAQSITATTGSIVQGMGFAQDASAAFSTEVVKLAGDLSSFNNIPIQETSLAIQAALTGEREQLKRLGIVVREVDVQERALMNTGKAAASALTTQEKATATLQLITERAGFAVGDLAKTQMSAANQAKALGAEIQNIKEDLSVALLPAMSGAITKFGEFIKGFQIMGAEAAVFGAQVKVLTASLKFWDKEGQFAAMRNLKLMEKAALEVTNKIIGLTNSTVALRSALVTADSEGVKPFIVDMAGLSDASHLVAGGLANMGLTGVKVFKDLHQTATVTVTTLGDLLTEIGPAMAATFIDSAISMKFAFRDMAQDMLKQIAKLAVKFAIFKGLQRLFPGSEFVGGIGKAFGFFDGGGRIGSGDFGIVGERGPELVQGPAMVTSRKDTAGMMGGDNVTNITIVGQSGEKLVDTITVRQRRNEKLGRVVRIPIPAAVVG